MSIELPEARIIAKQLDQVLKNKTITNYDVKDVDNLVRIGFINKDLKELEDIVSKKVELVVSRGNTVRVKLNDSMNLLIAPEYGGIVSYFSNDEKRSNYHLKVSFQDDSILTIRITSMGLIYAIHDSDLSTSYMYKRDFLTGISPDDTSFTWDWFKTYIGTKNKQLKPLLVGKDSEIVGVSNATFQDVLYRSGIHPKKKASELSEKQIKSLFDSIKLVLDERLEKGGKVEFTDVYGKSGNYIAPMGPNMKDSSCPKCGTAIQKISHGGGHVYLCPVCQSE